MEKLDVLRSKPLLIEELRKIAAYEAREQARVDKSSFGGGYRVSWQLLDVPTEYHPVKQLVLEGFVQKVGRKNYQLIDPEETQSLLKRLDEERSTSEQTMNALLSGNNIKELFNSIVGYEDLKGLFIRSLSASKPVHILMIGPPGTAKSLFLLALETLGATVITAGSATKAGIREVLTETPRILIIDELDKINSSKELSALLTWMESGKVHVTQHSLTQTFSGMGWVFAAANTTRGLPKELLDRFMPVHLTAYTPQQFVHVVTHYLKSTGVEPELAAYIATSVQRYSNSVREAVRVARLCESKADVDATIQIIRKYQPRAGTGQG